MKYICEKCSEEYTIPHGDYLIEKGKACKCGQPAKLFILKKYLIVESRSEIFDAALFLK